MPHINSINLIFRLLILSGCFFTVATSAMQNEEKPPLDTVVIMDSSGSMKQTDPKQLRKPAAKLFISLLDSTDKLSVVSFSSQAWPITFLTQLKSDRQINKALRATDKISHKGAYTNIHSAIEKGIDFLKESDQLNREPIIILMSDGQMDVGNKAKSQQLRQQIFDELLPQLIEYNIKIYSIAFTEASDQILLQEIADATDGRYALAASDDVLHKVFSKIFEQTKEPNMLPLHENQFIVDSSIKEITIIANKANAQSQIFLQPPSGDRINSRFKSKQIKWFESSSFDMITIQSPEEGEWKILFSDDDNRAYIVTDIKLRTDFEFNSESHQPELNIKAWFEQNEETEANQDLLSNMSLSLNIERPDGSSEIHPVKNISEDAAFSIMYKPQSDGIYEATMIAKSRTFQRQQTFSFKNTMPTEPAPVIEKAAPALPEEPQQALPEEPIINEPEVEEPIENEEPEDDLMQTLIYFGIANVIVIFLALNGFLVFRALKKKQPASAEAGSNDKE